ncbi:DUF3426 domain-containing protein [Duganella phyllosphaerae]|uniref:DUF3426 domain-containing protein n=1 Tax=Duganella phyllosphaerae TaxID=762836 RepID=UPI0008FC6423|nr:DUF3426 domain-containing protein [Duganella phyllosphaerae]
MALATKCPHCNTIFRVAHDQLKLRGGIVRCGSCSQVFDGNAALLEPLAPPSPPVFPQTAEPNDLNLDFDDLDDGALPPLPVTAAANLPDSVASLSLEFDDAPLAPTAPAPEVESEPWPELQPDPLPAVEQITAPVPEPTAQDLLSGDTLSDEELQAAIEAELAALDARMAAAQPAPALPPTPGPATPRGDERREPTLDFTPPPDELDEEDEQALLQLAAGAARPYDDIPPSHTLLRTVSAPPAGHYDEPQFHSTESLAAQPAADRHTFEQAAPAPVQRDQAEKIEETDDEPGFVKRERHRERYGRTTTIALCLGIVLMLGALAAQGLTTFRNPLAAAMPSLKPTLVAACNALGCKVELPSQIDELAIEQGELQALSENTFSFATALKNSSGSAQAWPHIELVLDDANDKTVLRRVFAPRDYLDREVDIAQGFPARSEQPVKLYFELKQPKVSGYHIAVFYP